MPTITNAQLRTLRAVAVAIVTYLLVQPIVQTNVLVMLGLGVLNVALAALNAPDGGIGPNA